MLGIYSEMFITLLLAVVFLLVLGYAGHVLVKNEIMTADTLKRAMAAITVFIAIYFGSGLVIGWTGYDMYLRAIEFLAAVIGGGCCWIGSNKR